MRRLSIALLTLGLLAVPVAATEVDVELLLAVDVSDSIQPDEAQLQREGYLAAITSPDTMRAIKEGTLGRIALAYMEWADARNQHLLVDWMLIESPDDAQAFAAGLAAEPIGTGFHTSISRAIDVAADHIETNNFDGRRRVIDVSGDGRNNKGRPLAAARAIRCARLAEPVRCRLERDRVKLSRRDEPLQLRGGGALRVLRERRHAREQLYPGADC